MTIKERTRSRLIKENERRKKVNKSSALAAFASDRLSEIHHSLSVAVD